MLMITNLPNKLRRRASFTLIEVLLVSAIIAILSLSLYRALSVGIKVWERSRMFSAEEDIMIFLDKLSMDLRNSMDFSLFEFEGKTTKIAFTTIVSVPMSQDGQKEVQFYADQIGRVEYGFDAARHSLYRRTANYGQAIDGEFGAPRQLVSSVKRVRFQYLKRNVAGLAHRTLERKVLPAAVDVSIYYEDMQGQMQVLKRMINVPRHF